MEDMHVAQQHPTILQEDNQGVIRMSLCKNEADRTKHWDYKIHFLRECVLKLQICFAYVRTGDQMADGNTKAIPRVQFQRERDHNNGTAIQSFKIDDKNFRENSGDSD